MKTFASIGGFREHYFPNMCKEERKPKQIIIIVHRQDSKTPEFEGFKNCLISMVSVLLELYMQQCNHRQLGET